MGIRWEGDSSAPMMTVCVSNSEVGRQVGTEQNIDYK